VRRKKNRVYPSPEAVSRAPDSRERLRKYSLQSDTHTERAPLTRLTGGGSWPRAVRRQTPHRRAYGPSRNTHIREGVRVARLYAHAGHAPLTSHL
jgi:hypothetical protein